VGLLALNFAFLDDNFPTRRRFSDSQELGGANCH